jgi:hypothetical protein
MLVFSWKLKIVGGWGGGGVVFYSSKNGRIFHHQHKQNTVKLVDGDFLPILRLNTMLIMKIC